MFKEKEFLKSETEISEKDLIQMLREKGIEDPETLALLKKWAEAHRLLVEKSADFSTEQILYTIRCARLYFEAGYEREAAENYASALIGARQEMREDLYDQIMHEIREKNIVSIVQQEINALYE